MNRRNFLLASAGAVRPSNGAGPSTKGPGLAAPAAAATTTAAAKVVGRYKEDSGTSMAAPHVSGVIAAFLSIRKEYIGHPEEVKRIFTSTATVRRGRRRDIRASADRSCGELRR